VANGAKWGRGAGVASPTKGSLIPPCRTHDVVFGGLSFCAEIVEDEAERERLGELADRVYPQYADFREEAGRTGRVIPLIQLVPRLS
jgi:hypothetical protein